MKVAPYYNEDETKIAVLLTRDFGAGWSTWSKPDLAYDSRVVQFYISHQARDEKWKKKASSMGTPQYNEMDHFLKSIGYKHIYLGGLRNLELCWVDVGRPWRIREYDGLETIEFSDDVEWCVI